MGETDLSDSNVGTRLIRLLFSTLDRPAFWLLGIVYELFFNVASADLFSNQTIMKFYGRVQVILGVFMMFQLSMSVLKGIVNPDSFTGDKGAKTLITKIITALLLLTVMMPISIPNPKNEYEIQINNNGLLFGTLYSLQHRILSNNTLGRLILGTTDSSSSFTSSSNSSSSSGDNELKKSARIFTSTIIKGFYRINLIPIEERDDTYLKEGKDPAAYNDNRVCTDISDEVLEKYTRIDADPGDIIGMVNETCVVDFNLLNYVPFIGDQLGSKKFVFTYMPVISMITALIFVFVLLKFTIDVAVRAVKLAVLRLIAPIPIISYMDPNKSGNDGAFNSWVKALSSTYLDLFIRLAIVYLVIFLIQDMIAHGIIMDVGTDIIGVLSFIIICIGLFMFANQAPKFIKQVLGMKDEGTGNLLGKIFAMGTAGAGIVGSAAANYRASKEENDQLHPNSKFNVFRNVGSSIAGAIGGGYTGFKAASAKDATARSVLDAQGQRNATRAAHSTFPGRTADSIYGAFTGQSLSSKGNNNLKAAQDWVKAQGDYKTSLEGEAKNNGVATNLGRGITARYAEVERAVASAHDGKVTINGTDYDANIFTSDFMDDALKAQVRSYQAGGTKVGGTSYADSIQAGGKLYAKRSDAIRLSRDVDVSELDSSIADNYKSYNVDKVDTYGKAIGAANTVISNAQNDMRQRMRNANNQQKK